MADSLKLPVRTVTGQLLDDVNTKLELPNFRDVEIWVTITKIMGDDPSFDGLNAWLRKVGGMRVKLTIEGAANINFNIDKIIIG